MKETERSITIKKDVREYLDMVHEFNMKWLDSSEDMNEKTIEGIRKTMENKFNTLAEKYGMDALLQEMGLA